MDAQCLNTDDLVAAGTVCTARQGYIHYVPLCPNCGERLAMVITQEGSA